jgi:chromosome segregation ATPase
MAIPSVMQGLIETEDGKVFELDSPKGVAWVETIGSFRFEPTGGGKPCTVRKEASGYWYGCRKVAGKVRKKYIGKSSEVRIAKLEEIAEALEVPPVPRVNKVAEVAQEVTQDVQVAERVAERVAEIAQDRLTALELEVANLRKAFEALQEALPGKSEAGNSEELPKADSEVAEELQNELSNLKAENEKLKQELVDVRANYVKLLESSGQIKASREKEISELRSQLEQERADREEVEAQLTDRGEQIRQLLSELADLKQKSATAGKDLPEAADLLNQLKSKRKKSKTDLADLETILEILES